MISSDIFHFFKLSFFGLLGREKGRGLKGQKISQNEKQQLHTSCAISQEQYSIWSWFLVHFCKMMVSPGDFFIFFEMFIIWAVRGRRGGLKGQGITQNGKQQLHPSRAISQAQYSLWSWVLVHLCKMMISSGAFFIFWYFHFSGC